jgi:putative phage-type endonuclease
MNVQRTDAWFAARCGMVTASRVADVIAKTRSGWGASRANYMAQIIAERLTGQPAESFCNAAMQWGTEQEPLARAAYQFRHDCDVVEVGFIVHPGISGSGASPDGLIGDHGLVELKCPNTATHIDTLLGEPIADKYIVQMQWQMACTQRSWCDFVSFDPRMPESMRYFCQRIERDDKRIRQLETEVEEFLAEVSSRVEALRSRFELQEAA